MLVLRRSSFDWFYLRPVKARLFNYSLAFFLLVGRSYYLDKAAASL